MTHEPREAIFRVGIRRGKGAPEHVSPGSPAEPRPGP